MVDAALCSVYAVHHRGRIHSAEHPENTPQAVHKPAGLKPCRPLLQCVAWNRLLLRVHRVVAADRCDPALDTADIAHRSTAFFPHNSKYRHSDKCGRVRGNVARDHLYVARRCISGRLGIRPSEADHLFHAKIEDTQVQIPIHSDPVGVCRRRCRIRDPRLVDPAWEFAELPSHDRSSGGDRSGLRTCCRNSLLADADRDIDERGRFCAKITE